MAKFNVGDCIDEHSITEVGKRYWSKGWRVDKALGKNVYRTLLAKGSRRDGTVTWTGAKNMRSSKRCEITLSEARKRRKK